MKRNRETLIARQVQLSDSPPGTTQVGHKLHLLEEIADVQSIQYWIWIRAGHVLHNQIAKSSARFLWN